MEGNALSLPKCTAAQAVPQADDALVMKLNPEDFKGMATIERNATINEELFHVAVLLAKGKEWVAAGKPGSFLDFLNADAEAIFSELLSQLDDLPVTERRSVEEALLGSFNSYFARVTQEIEAVSTLAELEIMRHKVNNTNTSAVSVNAKVCRA